jgi:threonine/homoserine/homoserine lactone efflux protein
VDWGSWRGKRILVIMLTELVAFVPVAAVVICTPGPDTALTIRNAVAGGRTAGILTAAGVAIGQGVWTVAASLGLTSLLRASAPAFLALKVAGAAYRPRIRRGLDALTGCVLIGLGVRLAAEQR